MPLLQNIFFFIIASLVLAASASWLVRCLSLLARFLRLTEFVIAFVLMAFSTSLPELFVGINAALMGNSALALGNVIGSNIVDLTLVMGIATVLARKIDTKKQLIKKDALWMAGIAAFPLVLMFFGNTLSRLDGLLLLVVFVSYTFYLLRQRQSFHKPLRNHVAPWKVIGALLGFIGGLIVLFYSADFVVEYGSALSFDLGLAPIFIGLFFVALGTSLPELVFSAVSVMKKHPQFVLGDIMGAVVINSTLVLGITALINPITANFLLFITSSAFLLVIAFLFTTFVESGGRLYWKEGIGLILLYVLFIIVELNVHQFAVLR